MITAEALNRVDGVRHGFLTRRGGVSDGVYASLNCGLGSGDHADKVNANRARALDRLGLDGSLVTAYQCHSARVVVVEEPWATGAAPEADGLVTNRPGVALGVLTADCAPVLLADDEAGVIGVAHAGWRGARDGIIEATVEAMTGLGATPSAMVAAIGPAIGSESYEVGAEFHRAFADQQTGNNEYFRAAERPGHFMFDLPAYVADRLTGLGLVAVEGIGRDTYAEEDLFFSYRRTTHRGERDYGRGLSAIALGP